jgi:hypothetical protein
MNFEIFFDNSYIQILSGRRQTGFPNYNVHSTESKHKKLMLFQNARVITSRRKSARSPAFLRQARAFDTGYI